MQKQTITIYHSPDSDDAFMFYGLTSGEVFHPEISFLHDLSDIETLNQLAIRGELDVTAVSVHAFAYLKDQYSILTCGASMGGEHYGPRLIARSDLSDLSTLKRVAIPGRYTSAALALQLALREWEAAPELVLYNFQEVSAAVERGEVDAGVIIHEGQLTYKNEGLTLLVDFGEWWFQKTGLPLPLGVNVIRKSLESSVLKASAQVLYESIDYSLRHRTEALAYAMRYARGISEEDADAFVAMYVNDLTLDLGERGKRSIGLFLKQAYEAGIIPALPEIEYVSPE